MIVARLFLTLLLASVLCAVALAEDPPELGWDELAP